MVVFEVVLRFRVLFWGATLWLIWERKGTFGGLVGAHGQQETEMFFVASSIVEMCVDRRG